jgi:hypothetical protein
MKTQIWAPIFGAVMAAGLASAAHAAPKPNPPTLHGFCSTANPCSDNGTNTPTSIDPPQFGFSAGGHDATGTVTIDILVPDNDKLPASYAISGAFLGKSVFTASEYLPKSGLAWTSGDLDSYLGISAKPSDPIGAYLPTTQTYDKGATGFYVFTANIGSVTLPSNSDFSDADLMTTGPGLLTGSYVVAFINQSGAYGTNSNSGAIFETGSSIATPEPASWALMLLGVGLTGATLRSRRRSALAPARA